MTFDELERLAKAATPGPWRHDTRIVLDAREDAVAMVNLARGPDDALADARFISFCSPERILAMIECIRAARAMRAEMDQVPPTGLERRLLHAFDIANAKLYEVMK